MASRLGIRRLDGKVILITGASEGIGAACADAFRRRGARLSLISRSEEKLRLVARPDDLITVGDLRDGAVRRKVIERTVAQFGRIDSLIHVMGGFAGGQSVADTDDATLEKMLDLNFKSAFYVLRAVIPHMRRSDAEGLAAKPWIVNFSREGERLIRLVLARSATRFRCWVLTLMSPPTAEYTRRG